MCWDGRLVQGTVEIQGDKGLFPGPEVSQEDRQIRQTPLQAAQSHRDHVRQAQGLAPRRNLLRLMPEGLPFSHCPRRPSSSGSENQ
mgnify:CR=1 FL=1